MQIVASNKTNIQFKGLIRCGDLNTRKQRLIYKNIENTLKSKCPILLSETADDVIVKTKEDGSLILNYFKKDLQSTLQKEDNVIKCRILEEDSIPESIKKSFEFIREVIKSVKN